MQRLIQCVVCVCVYQGGVNQRSEAGQLQFECIVRPKPAQVTRRDKPTNVSLTVFGDDVLLCWNESGAWSDVGRRGRGGNSQAFLKGGESCGAFLDKGTLKEEAGSE